MSCNIYVSSNMTGKTRRVFPLIVKNFIDSLMPSNKIKLKGIDHFGTKYYEKISQNPGKPRPTRYFEPVEEENFEQEIPAEWEAWLRHRRLEPPTNEEVAKSHEIMIMKKNNAAELAKTYENKTDVTTQSANPTGLKFPVYEEYKNYGQHYIVRHKKENK